jgi:hypothetical protein
MLPPFHLLECLRQNRTSPLTRNHGIGNGPRCASLPVDGGAAGDRSWSEVREKWHYCRRPANFELWQEGPQFQGGELPAHIGISGWKRWGRSREKCQLSRDVYDKKSSYTNCEGIIQKFKLLKLSQLCSLRCRSAKKRGGKK